VLSVFGTWANTFCNIGIGGLRAFLVGQPVRHLREDGPVKAGPSSAPIAASALRGLRRGSAQVDPRRGDGCHAGMGCGERALRPASNVIA
jgi:hypothetical protein